MRLRIFWFVTFALLTFETTAHATTRARMRAETVLNDASVRLSAGALHTCQVKDDGTVRCWGVNLVGQLGDGSGVAQLSPVPVSGITSAVAVAAGGAHTCALLAEGTVRCWGDNAFGQLGDNSQINKFTPVAVVGLTNVVSIAAGKEHTCAVLANSTARCWGNNTDGKLGNQSTTKQLVPVTVLNINFTTMGNVAAISAGAEHTCALFITGTARCWGTSSGGRLGFTTPGGPVAGLTNATAIAAGGDFTCALISGGFVSCWGLNGSGQLGNNTVQSAPTPVFAAGLPTATSITAGPDHTCVRLGDGTARCWGNNVFGQIGDGSNGGIRLTGVPVAGLTNAVNIVANGLSPIASHTCALLADGSVRCWGFNGFGELGDGTGVNSPTAVAVLGGGGSVTARAIAAGRNHTCAVRANSTVSCWGSDASGQLGDGATGVNRLAPVNVSGLNNVIGIAAGEAHTCALIADGSVRCWGDNSSGQLGDGTFTLKSTPVPVPGIFRAIAIAAGGTLGSSHTCALTAEGGVSCWGSNSSGQLGDGTFTRRPTAAPVVNLSTVTSIAVGELYSCALLASGAGRCWGANNNGQIGDGTGSTKTLPTAILGLTNMVAIAGGNLHACAILADGTARCWGGNLLGQVGDGTTFNAFVPVPVSGLTNAVTIAGGFGHSCAILASGGAMCWGDNSSGQLGNASTTSSLVPTSVGSKIFGIGITLFRPLTRGVIITTGRRHSCALNATGAVLCWGENIAGQVGINSTNAMQTSPATVPSFILNIGLTVTVAQNKRVATVTVLAACDEGQKLRFEVNVTQGSVSGKVHGTGECTGGLEGYAVKVAAEGPLTFAAGPAVVSAEAIIDDHGPEVEEQQWTRQVNIVQTQ